MESDSLVVLPVDRLHPHGGALSLLDSVSEREVLLLVNHRSLLVFDLRVVAADGLADEDEEFLESYPELALSVAIKENRVWSWGNDGGIRSGITTPRSELLVTKRAWIEETEVDTNG